jgi:DNA polymerase elongation subunit (family B)
MSHSIFVTSVEEFVPKGKHSYDSFLLVFGRDPQKKPYTIVIEDFYPAFSINVKGLTLEDQDAMVAQLEDAVPYPGFPHAPVVETRHETVRRRAMAYSPFPQETLKIMYRNPSIKRFIYQEEVQFDTFTIEAGGVWIDGIDTVTKGRLQVGVDIELIDYDRSWSTQLLAQLFQRHDLRLCDYWDFLELRPWVPSDDRAEGPLLQSQTGQTVWTTSWKHIRACALKGVARTGHVKLMSVSLRAFSSVSQEDHEWHRPDPKRDAIQCISAMAWYNTDDPQGIPPAHKKSRKQWDQWVSYQRDLTYWSGMQKWHRSLRHQDEAEAKEIQRRLDRLKPVEEAKQEFLQVDTHPAIRTFTGSERTLLNEFSLYIAQEDPDVILYTEDESPVEYLSERLGRQTDGKRFHMLMGRMCNQKNNKWRVLGRHAMSYTRIWQMDNEGGVFSPKLEETTFPVSTQHVKVYAGLLPPPGLMDPIMAHTMEDEDALSQAIQQTRTEVFMLHGCEGQNRKLDLFAAQSNLLFTNITAIVEKRSVFMVTNMLYVNSIRQGFLPNTLEQNQPLYLVPHEMRTLRSFDEMTDFKYRRPIHSDSRKKKTNGKRMSLFGKKPVKTKRTKFISKEQAVHQTDHATDQEALIKAKHVGGKVQESDKGKHFNVFTWDFASLYPSIGIAYNMCTSMIVYEDMKEYVEAHPELEREYIPIGNGKDCLVVIQSPDNIIPRMWKELLSSRKVEKKKLKAATDPMMIHKHDTNQKAIKISANSIYGVLTFILKWIAKMICLIGQHMIGVVRDCVEQKYDANTIYGDTDSIMIQLPNSKHIHRDEIKQRMFDLWPGYVEMGRYMTDNFFKPPNDLEMERGYTIFYAFDKKMYIGVCTEENPGGPYKRLMKGLPHIKRDRCGFVRNELGPRTADELVEPAPHGLIKLTVDYHMYLLYSHQVPLHQLSLTKRLGETSTVQIHQEVANKLKAAGGRLYRQGDRVRYVVRTGPEDLSHRGEDPLVFLEQNYQLDYEYLFESQIEQAIFKIIQYEGLDITTMRNTYLRQARQASAPLSSSLQLGSGNARSIPVHCATQKNQGTTNDVENT